jgi:hypothetical protein
LFSKNKLILVSKNLKFRVNLGFGFGRKMNFRKIWVNFSEFLPIENRFDWLLMVQEEVASD